jgi:hypothetical protein
MLFYVVYYETSGGFYMDAPATKMIIFYDWLVASMMEKDHVIYCGY